MSAFPEKTLEGRFFWWGVSGLIRSLGCGNMLLFFQGLAELTGVHGQHETDGGNLL
jgi:hypothetical protein